MTCSRIGPRPTAHPSLRVLTHNIYNTEGGWDDRVHVLKRGLPELDADLLFFQETVLTDEWDQVAELVGAGYHLAHSQNREPDGFGVAIASRWPIVRHEEVGMLVTQRTGDFPSAGLIAEIEAPEPFGRVLVVNHFPDPQPDRERERELQTVRVARRIEELVASNPAHVIVAGDMDAEPDAASMRFLSGRQSLEGMSVCYRDAWDRIHPGEPGLTFHPGNHLVSDVKWDWPFHQIDHIFVRCGDEGQPTLDITACELAFDEPVDGVWGSDHIAVVADLRMPVLPG